LCICPISFSLIHMKYIFYVLLDMPVESLTVPSSESLILEKNN
jgi:hypothetical protein